MPNISQVDQNTFQQLLASDPEIQAVIRTVWGDTPVNQRPSDTPKHLEQANHRASEQIGQILKARGVQLPSHTFINPRTASLEGMHGWAGLPTGVKIALIAAAGATGIGAAGALGAFGGAAAAGGAGGAGAATGAASAAVPTLGVTGGLSAGAFPAIAGTAGAAGGTMSASGGILGALKAAAAAKAKDPKSYTEMLGSIGSVLGKQQEGATKGRIAQADQQSAHDRNAISLYDAQQGAQTQAGQLDLQRKGFESANRGTSAKQALIGALLGGGLQATKIGPGGASGGLLASLNGNPDALAAMKLLGSQGAQAQRTPLEFAGGEMVKPPTLAPVAQVDKGGILSTLANITQLAGAASPYLKKPGTVTDDQQVNY